jgi:hypothetical protein
MSGWERIADAFGVGIMDDETRKRLSAQQRKQMGQAALLDAGIAMLANSGYSSNPQTLGQVLGQGLQAGRSSTAAQGQAIQEQMALQQRAQQEEMQRQQFLSSVPPEMRHLAAVLDPKDLAKLIAEQKGRINLEREKAALKPVVSYRDLTPQEARARGYDPSKSWQINEGTGRVMQVGGGGVNLTNNIGAENHFARALASKDADTYDKWRSTAMSAGDVLSTLDNLEQINALEQGGRIGDATALIGQIFGTEAAANRQTFQADSYKLLMKQAEAMPGVLSDSDIKLLAATGPSFGNDPRANQIIIDVLRRNAKKAIQNFESADDHLAKRGDLRGFRPLISLPGPAPNVNAASVDFSKMSTEELQRMLDERRRGGQ